MPVLKFVARLRDHLRLSNRLDALATTVSQRVRQELPKSVASMPRAEARGYIRARSTPIVREALQSLAGDHRSLSRNALDRYSTELNDRVTKLVLDEVVKARTWYNTRRAA